MPYRVRRALRDDIPAIIEFQIAMALETENLHLDPEKVRRGVQIPFERDNVATYYVCEEVDSVEEAELADAASTAKGESLTARGYVCSMLMITFEWSDWRGGAIHWIQSVFTHVDHRRRGLFKMLFQYVKQRVEEDPEAVAIRLYVEHENVIGIAAYRSLGLEMEDGYRMMKWSKLRY
jgi:ribosomal protein S18 acetylase RimI-like enzyme